MGKRVGRWRVAAACAVVVLVPAPAAAGADGQSVHDSQWALEASHAREAWSISRGSGVTVAVVDGGVDASHPDLRGQVTGGGDFGDGASGDGTQDAVGPRGHGTEVASLVAGTGRNFHGHGLLGLAPGAHLLSFGAYRAGAPDPAAVARAIRSAVREDAQVIVTPAMDLGRGEVAPAVQEALNSDVVVVSGVRPRRGADTDPGAVPGVLTVAAVDGNGKAWPRPGAAGGAVLAAPGVQMLTAASDGSYWTGDDPGFAAAWAAGAAALVRAARPDWTARQTVNRLLQTASVHGDGCSGRCDYGLVNPARALSRIASPATERGGFASSATSDQAPGTERTLMPGGLLAGLAVAALLLAAVVGYAVGPFRRRP